jgi:hypothetical protein
MAGSKAGNFLKGQNKLVNKVCYWTVNNGLILPYITDTTIKIWKSDYSLCLNYKLFYFLFMLLFIGFLTFII